MELELARGVAIVQSKGPKGETMAMFLCVERRNDVERRV